MSFHPLQDHKESIDKLSDIFRERMEKKGILPKNPFVRSKKIKELEAWLANMGGRLHLRLVRASYGRLVYDTDSSKYFCFRVRCQEFGGRKGHRRKPIFFLVEIPWDVADKVLMLGFVP